MEAFERERVRLGSGMTAEVYAYGGYAYKCYRDFWPDALIAHEARVLQCLAEAGLPAVRCYPCEFPRALKLELLGGVTLTERVRARACTGTEELLALHRRLHAHHGLDLPALAPYLRTGIGQAPVSEALRTHALACLDALPDDDALCHMDLHFQNVLCEEDRLVLIDWLGAANGNPILDYARTYIILYEFARPLSEPFLRQLERERLFAADALQKAIYAVAVHRLSQYDDPAVRPLLAAPDAPGVP